MDCEEAPPIIDGTMTVAGTQFGDKVTYECNDGFYMDGNDEAECQANGDWQPNTAPICNRNSKYAHM